MTSPNDEPKWLTVEDVKQLHRRSIERFGGSPGVLDERILESAVMTPQQSAFGMLAHPTLEAQAAAYLFHITKGHAFEDGNKRTGLLACETFLGLNGKELSFTDREAYSVTMQVASGGIGKDQLTRLMEGAVQDLKPSPVRSHQPGADGPAPQAGHTPTPGGQGLEPELSRGPGRGIRRGI